MDTTNIKNIGYTNYSIAEKKVVNSSGTGSRAESVFSSDNAQDGCDYSGVHNKEYKYSTGNGNNIF